MEISQWVVHVTSKNILRCPENAARNKAAKMCFMCCYMAILSVIKRRFSKHFIRESFYGITILRAKMFNFQPVTL